MNGARLTCRCGRRLAEFAVDARARGRQTRSQKRMRVGTRARGRSSGGARALDAREPPSTRRARLSSRARGQRGDNEQRALFLTALRDDLRDMRARAPVVVGTRRRQRGASNRKWR